VEYDRRTPKQEHQLEGYEMRCKQCLQVVRHPSVKSKIVQICGVCRKYLSSVRSI